MTDTFPAPFISKGPAKIRVLGTDVTLIDPIKSKAEADLNIELDFIILDGIEAQRRGALSPDSFDIYDQWFHDVDLIWPAQSIKPIKVDKIDEWDEIISLPTFVDSGTEKKGGGAPHRRLFVETDGQLSTTSTQNISMLPTVHNADSFAIVGETWSEQTMSWGALLSVDWAGRVALHSDGAIGVIDLLLAFQAKGELKFDDLGNLSVEEIDIFIRLARQYQVKRQFHSFWTDRTPLPKGKQKKSILSTMWWSNYIEMKANGFAITMCTPQEGYRGWFGGMALSTAISDYCEGAAYEYMNWWLSGEAGAIMARNGAYISTPTISRKHMTKNEWGFWYEGAAAEHPILDTYGRQIFEIGAKREGGSYADRMNNIAIWNSVMDEHNLLVRLWDALIEEDRI